MGTTGAGPNLSNPHPRHRNHHRPARTGPAACETAADPHAGHKSESAANASTTTSRAVIGAAPTIPGTRLAST